MTFFAGRKFYILILAGLAVILSLVLVYSDQGLVRMDDLKAEKTQLESENKNLKEENRRLLMQIERLKSDPRCIEDEARKKLGLIKPNESIYRLQEEPDSTASGQGDQ